VGCEALRTAGRGTLVTAADTSSTAGSGDGGSRLVHCTTYAEIALPASRAFIGSLIRPFLDQLVITPTELVFSGRHQMRLDGSGTLLTEAIEKAAGMQARALSQPPMPRMRELQTLVAQLMVATKEIERVEPLQPLKPGQLASTMESLRANAAPAALAPRVYRILTETLSGARVWGEKIELAVGLAQEALTCDAGEYLDPLLGEIILSELAQDVIFGRMISAEARINGLLALLKGEYEGDQYSPPAAATLELNKLMGQAKWPELRAAIETAIVAYLAGKLPLRSSDLLGELRALHGLLGRLRDGSRTIGGRRALEFIDRRMARLLSQEAISDHLRECASMLERMIALVELYAVTFGPTNRKLVSDFITRYFADEDFDRRLMAGEGAPQHKLALLTRLYRVVLTSSIQAEDKQIYARRLIRIQANFLDSSKLFAAIDRQHTNSARRCQHVVSLCVEGCFIPGDNLDRAKTLIRHYMGKPDFMDKLNEGQTRTESGRVESVEQFKANLKKLNIPAPFDA
jgi:hypothetical protein